MDNYQGNVVINYTDIEIPYNWIIEYKYFESLYEQWLPKNTLELKIGAHFTIRLTIIAIAYIDNLLGW